MLLWDTRLACWTGFDEITKAGLFSAHPCVLQSWRLRHVAFLSRNECRGFSVYQSSCFKLNLISKSIIRGLVIEAGLLRVGAVYPSDSGDGLCVQASSAPATAEAFNRRQYIGSSCTSQAPSTVRLQHCPRPRPRPLAGPTSDGPQSQSRIFCNADLPAPKVIEARRPAIQSPPSHLATLERPQKWAPNPPTQPNPPILFNDHFYTHLIAKKKAKRTIFRYRESNPALPGCLLSTESGRC